MGEDGEEELINEGRGGGKTKVRGGLWCVGRGMLIWGMGDAYEQEMRGRRGKYRVGLHELGEVDKNKKRQDKKSNQVG